MKLKTRIVISFFVIILEPLICASVAFWAFSQHQLNVMEEQYGIENASYDSLSNTAEVINSMTDDIAEELRETAKKDTKELENEDYLNRINGRLKEVHSYLLVREGNQIIYYGNENYSSELVKRLPPYASIEDENSEEAIDAQDNDGLYLGGTIQALVKQINFEKPDGTQGSVFIVSSILKTLPQLKSLIKNMMISVVVILILTGLGLTWWIYRGVIAPLDKLRTATQKIKDGDLDFSITPEGVSEISDLCQDFEEMRQRLKETSEEKVQFDKESKELISNISHDLKTPITAIKGYVEGIMDGVADTPEKMDRYVRTIYNKTNEMDHLINELTFYSKIDTNRIPYTFSKLNVEDYFSDCAEELGLEMETRGIELVYANYVEKGVQVIADGEQIRRVIHNIVSNAIKYMEKPRGIIQLRVKDVGDFIQVEIEDNGKGIAAKDLPYIFDRFYRTDVSRNSSKGGSGIGLSIVKKIMEDHGGKVWATSRLGIGTIMYFVLRKYQEVPMNE